MDIRIKESGNSFEDYQMLLGEKLERIDSLKTRDKPFNVTNVKAYTNWARSTLTYLDVTGGDASLKREVALVPARLGAGLWGAAFLGREPAIELFGNTLCFSQPFEPDDLMWNDAFRFAQIAHATDEIEILTAWVDNVPPPKNYDAYFRFLREGLSAHIGGDGQQAADGYLNALKFTDPEDPNLYMDPNSLLDLQIPALELWDAIFQQKPEQLKTKLVEACDWHRAYYRRERMLNNPDSFISLSAWAARSWAHRLGWDFEIDHPALPAVLPWEGDAGR